MNYPPNFRSFFWPLFASFLFTWGVLVVYPWVQVGHLPPIEEDGSTELTPWDLPGTAHQGELVYAADGCAYCHTQQVRPASSGADIIRGWGTAKDAAGDDKAPPVIRRSYPRDYIWQHQTFLGNSRNGADLSNVGERFATAAELYRYLYDPYLLNPHSSMPEYRFLFRTQRISGAPSVDALVLNPIDAPAPGWEVVPTSEGKALAAYLLSLKKGYHLKPDEGGYPYVPPTKS